MAKEGKTIKQRTKAAIKTLNEDVASWAPQPKGWPAVGDQRGIDGDL
jgi:hypothetical protein